MILWVAGALAMYMAWAIGANDVANAMGTSVGSGALTIRRAVIVAAVLEFSGALFVGGHVTDTVRKGILDMQLVQADPQLLLYGITKRALRQTVRSTDDHGHAKGEEKNKLLQKEKWAR